MPYCHFFLFDPSMFVRLFVGLFPVCLFVSLFYFLVCLFVCFLLFLGFIYEVLSFTCFYVLLLCLVFSPIFFSFFRSA